MAEHKRFKINQSAFLRNAAGKLLILEQDGRWMLPGGRLEEGESWEDGLRREIREETGISDIAIVKPLSVAISDSQETYAIAFLCDVAGIPEIRISSEHRDYAWIDLGTMHGYEYWHPDMRKRIEQYFIDMRSEGEAA